MVHTLVPVFCRFLFEDFQKNPSNKTTISTITVLIKKSNFLYQNLQNMQVAQLTSNHTVNQK
jgi:hypothetical protein